MGQLIFRFLVGGLIVSFFAALGDVLKPKSFAGLFSAAPSVALATLALTSSSDGKMYAAIEARSMAAAAASFLIYACVCSRLLMGWQWHAAKTTIMALTVWFAVSFALWFAFLK
jgi:Protein of unknown function (DUF3147)